MNWFEIFSKVALVQFCFLVINLILYSVPPTKPLHVHFSLCFNVSHLDSLFSSPTIHWIQISPYEPLGKLVEFKYISNEFDVFLNSGWCGSLTLSRSLLKSKNLIYIKNLKNKMSPNYPYIDSEYFLILHQSNFVFWLWIWLYILYHQLNHHKHSLLYFLIYCIYFCFYHRI